MIVGQIPAGSTFLDVDSTVGFPSEGELFIIDIDGSSLHLTYTGKTINQFTGVGGLNNIIDDQSEIRLIPFLMLSLDQITPRKLL